MGKIKRGKNKPHVQSPTGLASVKETHSNDASPEDNTIENIMEQLQSADLEEKYCGLQTLAFITEDPNRFQDILNCDVRVIAPLMLDNAPCIRNATAGALRNFSTLGCQLCEKMIEQDIMTPLITAFHKHADGWTPKENKKNKFDEDGDTVIQLTNLLWNLCEHSETAIKHLNESHIIDILIKFLDRKTFGDDITIASLQCLFVVTEDNMFAISKTKPMCKETLQKLLIIDGDDPSLLLQKILAAGIMLNFCDRDITSLQSEVIGLIISSLATTLSVDHRTACNQLTSVIPLEAQCPVKTPNVTKNNEQMQMENHLKSVHFLLEAQQTAVEIVANLCSLEGSDGESMDTDNASDSEEEINDDDLSNCSNGDVLPIEDKLTPEVMEGIVSTELFSKVWAKTVLPPENTLQILENSYDGKNVYKKICHLRSRSFLCINNMISCLPIETLGGLNEVYRMWIDTGKTVFKTSANNDELLESATSVMRAALDKIKRSTIESPNLHNELFDSLALSDVELMLNGIRHCDVPTIRANLIRMVGILALFFVAKTSDAAVDIAASITNFILEHSHKETEAWVLAESIDVLMDLYSEDETDALAMKIDLVSKMTSLVPILKNKVRQQRKSLGENNLIVSTAITNLPRFIKYKKNNIIKLKS